MATSVPVPIARPEVGLGERRRVVDAVADHRHDAALGLQAADHVGLAGRQHLGDHLVDADLGGDRARGRLVVAGQQHGPQAERLAATRPPRRSVGLTVSATTSTARARPSQPAAIAVRPRASAAGGPRRASGSGACAQSASSAGRPTTTRMAVDDALDAEALAVGEALDGRQRAARPRRRRRSPGRSGARRRARARRRGAAPRAVDAVGDDDVDEAHPAGGDGAGLVEHDGVDPARGLEHLRALDQQAELRAAAGADHQRRRRREPERARAGDDQHRDGGGERERRASRPCRARTRASRRRGR